MMPNCHKVALQASLFLGLAGCASYHEVPLDLAPPLKSAFSALDHRLPDGGFIPLTLPSGAQNVAALAVLNDPELVAARAQRKVAQANLLSAGLLPDPSVTGGFAAFISGPGTVPAISGGLAEDASALITYPVDRQAAKAGLAQVDAGILWQEWQVASRAMQLCITIDGDTKTIGTLRADHAALAGIDAGTEAQVRADNLTIAASSASMAALAATDTALDTAIETRDQDRDQLDALLGLQPGIDIPVALPDVQPADPRMMDKAIASLAYRRPDLIALRYGYAQADAKLRAAILTQFLPVNIGGTGGRDTTDVWSAGPQITLTLPLFNRNRGGIAVAAATRAQLAAQFDASLASAEGDAGALMSRIGVLRRESNEADGQSAAASAIARQAQQANANGSLDALSAVNLQTASADRQREAIALNVQLLTARLSLDSLLGLGLPPMADPGLEAAP
jgi:outer membrane protein TolC